MIHSLSYEVRFSAGTKRKLSADINFPKGLTAITGPNEQGKSMIIEMIRYGLFGSTALRGVSTDYEYLSCTLNVRIGSHDYLIVRTGRDATIHRAEECLAVGTTPVNKKITEILGYDIDVFDVAHAAMQGDIEELGKMKSSDRKRMVDRVIGADRIDEVQKWTAEQATLLNREITSLQNQLREPVPPAEPMGYLHSAKIASEIVVQKANVAEQNHLLGWLSNPPRHPQYPVRQDGVPSRQELEAELVATLAIEADIALVSKLKVLDFDPVAATAAVKAWDNWQERVRFVAQHPVPTMTAEEVEEKTACGLALLKLKELRSLRERLSRSTRTACPECKTVFCLEHSALQDVDEKISAIGVIDETPIRGDLVRQQQMIDDWAKESTRQTWDNLKNHPGVPKPHITMEQIYAAVGGVTAAEKAARMPPAPVRSSTQIRGVIQGEEWFEKALATAQQMAVVFDDWTRASVAKRDRVAELNGCQEALVDLERQYERARGYETLLDIYYGDKEYHEADLATIDAKKEELEGWKAAKSGLADIRVRIKTYLVPSLSKVASSLLYQMTDGARSSIVVDEEFEVMVDGQRLNTLSGSAKAVANLSLRIGLGQVLTNNIFSVFIGDEIDAAMDEKRAALTHLSVSKLTGSISQIILITHKVPVADNIIELGKAYDGQRK